LERANAFPLPHCRPTASSALFLVPFPRIGRDIHREHTAKPLLFMSQLRKLLAVLLGAFALYLLAYAYARALVFHAVERYAGAEGKGSPRQDVIAKKDRSAGEGWEYALFLPAIKFEESLRAASQKR
jgi:hypothetical protein